LRRKPRGATPVEGDFGGDFVRRKRSLLNRTNVDLIINGQ